MKHFNIKNYYFYTFFSNILLFIPVIIYIYINRGIHIKYIFLLEAVYYACIFLFEIPFGYLADKVGHKKIALYGCVLQGIGYLTFAYSYKLSWMILSQVILGISESLISGSDQATMFDSLKDIFTEREIFKVQKNANIISVYAGLISYILGGILITINPSGTIILAMTGICIILSGLFFYKIKTPYQNKKDSQLYEGSHFSYKIEFEIIISGIVSGILMLMLVNYNWILQLFYENLHLNGLFVGIIYAISSILTILLSKWNIFKSTNNLLILVLLPISYFLVAFKWYSIIPLVVLIYSIVKIELQPFIENWILSISNKYGNGATNLSISSWTTNLIQVLLLILYYWLFDKLKYEKTVIFLGILVFILFILAIYSIKKYHLLPNNRKRDNSL